MAALDQNYMAKSKTKTDYIEELQNIVAAHASHLTIKKLKRLIDKYQ